MRSERNEWNLKTEIRKGKVKGMSEREGNFLWNVGDQKTARDSGIGRGQLGFIGLSQIEEVSIGH